MPNNIHQKSKIDTGQRRENLQLALRRLVLKKSLVPRVGVKHQVVDGVLLAGPAEQIGVDVTVVPTETAVQLPVGDGPGIDETHGVGADLVEELHHGGGAGQTDLADGDGTGGEELGSFALESVQGVEAEELVHEGLGVLVQGLGEFGGGDGLVEVLDD